jgi:hypothetical protein
MELISTEALCDGISRQTYSVPTYSTPLYHFLYGETQFPIIKFLLLQHPSPSIAGSNTSAPPPRGGGGSTPSPSRRQKHLATLRKQVSTLTRKRGVCGHGMLCPEGKVPSFPTPNVGIGFCPSLALHVSLAGLDLPFGPEESDNKPNNSSVKCHLFSIITHRTPYMFRPAVVIIKWSPTLSGIYGISVDHTHHYDIHDVLQTTNTGQYKN